MGAHERRSLVRYALVLSCSLNLALCMRVTGHWRNTELVNIVAKFGFQRTDAHNVESTRGFVFGNATADTARTDGAALFVLLSDHYATQFRQAARYVALVSCHLNATTCKWAAVRTPVSFDYDMWLVNGKPSHNVAELFTYQFSFDQQNTLEIYMCAALGFVALCVAQCRAQVIYRHAGARPPTRSQVLFGITAVQVSSVCVSLLDMFVYALDGCGLPLLRHLAAVLWLLQAELLCALVVALASGYGILSVKLSNAKTFFACAGVLAACQFALFVWNSFVVDDLEEIDTYETLPGYLMIAVRLVYILWFLYNVKVTLATCIRRHQESRGEFVLHMAAAFLVWLVYTPALGLLATKLPTLYKFKLMLGITFMCDWLAVAALVHIFWPRSTNRRFFVDNWLPLHEVDHGTDVDDGQSNGAELAGRRRRSLFQSTNSDDWDDFETALLCDEIVPVDPLSPATVQADRATGSTLDAQNELFAPN